MERRPFEIRFKLGPFPVAVEPTFWLMAALLSGLRGSAAAVISWIASVFVSVLIHEAGHALVIHRAGARAAIRLYAFGGVTFPSRALGRWPGLAMALAGPFAGFGLGGLVYLIGQLLPDSPYALQVIRQLLFINFGWGLLNLVPVMPLDGGHVLLGLLGPQRQRAGLIAGGLFGAGLCALAASHQQLYVAILFALFAFRSLQAGLARTVSGEEALTFDQALARGWERLTQGEGSDARQLGTAVLLQSPDPNLRNRARDLLAWCALSHGEHQVARQMLEGTEPPQAARSLTWAMVLESVGEQSAALPHAQRALEEEPSETAASLTLRLLLHQKDLERAELLAHRHAWSKPGAREVALGEVAFARGSYPSAAGLFEAAFQLSGQGADAFRAGRSYARAGDREQAVHWIRRALDAGFEDLDELAQSADLAAARADPEIARRLRLSPFGPP